MPFEVRQDDQTRVVEVVYPAEPTALEIADYVARLRKLIDAQEGDWVALVDQTRLKTLTPELVEALKVMNAYAQSHGMKKIARLVPDAFGTMYAWRLSRETALSIPFETFTRREDALAWLTSDTPRSD